MNIPPVGSQSIAATSLASSNANQAPPRAADSDGDSDSSGSAVAAKPPGVGNRIDTTA